MHDYNISLSTVTLLLCILIFCRSLMLRKRSAEQSALLAIQTKTLEEIENKLNIRKKATVLDDTFQENLKQAEVTTELQKSRSSLVHNRNTQRPPERYRYAQSMFQSGMQTEEISSALGMSRNEITQLLKLASISCESEHYNNENKMLSIV